MKLFDVFERKEDFAAPYSESQFNSLNRIARGEFDRIRQVLENWFDHYPDGEKLELKARFRSDIDTQHQGAFFELFLHELLLRLNCKVTLHPEIAGTTSTPDFLVKTLNGEKFYLEATITTNETDDEKAAQARMNVVYDVLNNSVTSKNFFLWLELRGAPNTVLAT